MQHDVAAILRTLDEVFETAPQAIVTVSTDRRVLSWNQGAERIFGWRRDEVLGRPLPFVPDEIDEEVRRLHAGVLEGRPFSGIEIRRRRRDGSAVDLLASASRLDDAEGRIRGLILTMSDVTERSRAREAQRERLDFLQSLIDAVPVPIFYKGADLRYLGCNEAFVRCLGRSREEIVGSSAEELLPDHAARFHEADLALLRDGTTQAYEGQVPGADGSLREVLFNKAVLRDESGAISGIVGTLLDISERKRAEERLAHQAYHDALTGLPNRMLFTQRLQQALAQARRNGEMVAVAFIDLDRFKLINDTLGHAAGDALLQQVAMRLRECVRSYDTLARMGGDEFTVLLPVRDEPRAVARVCERILAAMATPFVLHGRELVVSASIGISLYPMDGDDAGVLLQRADGAMYRAKEAGKNCYRLFSPETQDAVHSRLELEADLRRAVARNELQLVYQPQVRLVDRAVVGFEALLRWQHRELGAVPPSRFVPIAEESGLIVRLGAWVLKEACSRAVGWQAEGRRPVRIAVNVSARQLGTPDFVETVAQVLEETGLPPALLELELTESGVMRDPDEAACQLARLQALGVRVSIDDFGTGFSSLSRLQRLSLDQLKIDRAFVAEMEAERSTLPLAAGIVTLAHALGLQVVAEGVETERQAEILVGLGCEEAQGWLFGRPLPLEAAEALLDKAAAVA